MGNKVSSLAAFAFASVVGVAAPASAQGTEAPRIKDGPYVIEVQRLDEDPAVYSRFAGCMIVSNNGKNSIPSLYWWGGQNVDSSWCGLSGDTVDIMRNGQAVWQIASIWASNGKHAYVVKSHVNGRCLIRGSNGYAGHPSLHLWTGLPGGDAKYCGFRNADALIENGQAAWSFDTSGYGWGVFVHSAWTGNSGARLAFATPPVYPNTDPNSAFASFTQAANPWFFVFWPTEY